MSDNFGKHPVTVVFTDGDFEHPSFDKIEIVDCKHYKWEGVYQVLLRATHKDSGRAVTCRATPPDHLIPQDFVRQLLDKTLEDYDG